MQGLDLCAQALFSLPCFLSEHATQLLPLDLAIEQRLCSWQTTIDGLDCTDTEKKAMTVPLSPLEHCEGAEGSPGSPGSSYGPRLDAGIYKMVSTKQKEFSDDVGPERRNELKDRFFKFGDILRIVQNNLQQPHGKFKELSYYFNKCFSAVRYGVGDMAAQLTNKPDACDV